MNITHKTTKSTLGTLITSQGRTLGPKPKVLIKQSIATSRDAKDLEVSFGKLVRMVKKSHTEQLERMSRNVV